MTERPDAPCPPPLAAAESPGSVAQNVLDVIGRTPLVRLSRMETQPSASVWGKAEFSILRAA